MAIDYATLFARLGKGLFAQKQLNTARGTTVPPEVKDFVDQFNNASLDLKRAIAPAEPALRNFQAGSAALMTGLQQSLQQTVIETVHADTALARKDITSALQELIRQMTADAQSVDASTVAASASAITGSGDGVLVASTKRGDGLVNENMLAETVKIECTGDTNPATATFSAKGDLTQRDRLAHDWPLGSGISRGLTAVSAASSLLTNGDFEDEDDRANSPDGWVVSVGTVGTTLKITDTEVQQIVVTGPPTAGTYTISVTNAAGKVQTTAPLAYDASGAAVQSAIRALEGFETVEVTTTGTSPLYTHVIAYTGIAGNLPRLRISNSTTGGTYTVSTTTQGPSVTEVQTVAISGTPTGGTYTLTYTDASGSAQTTSALAFNATSAQVQAALRLLEGLEEVTVSESGVSPNLTHTITFTGIGGNIAQLTSTNSLTGGTPVITHATTTQGIDLSFIGKALEFDSDGAQLTAINCPVSLQPLTQYAVNVWMMADVVPAAGVVTIDLVDGIGGSVINDQQGAANSFTVTCSALTTSFVAKNGVFRTPKALPAVVYLRIRISTAVSAGSSIFFDQAAMAKMDALYDGGPEAKIFSGKTSFRKGSASGQILPDYFILTVTNDRAGEFQEWFDRNLLMREKGLLLPSNAAGAETQADTLIA